MPFEQDLQPSRAAGSARGGLFRKYFAFIVLLVSVGLVVSGAIGLYFSYRESRNSLAGLQREKALTAAVRIENFLRDIENQMGWTTLPLVTESRDPLEHRRLDFLKLLRQVPAITEVRHLDGAGREQLKVSRLEMDVAGSGVDYSKDPRFVEARKQNTWYGPVYFRQETEPYMTISIPEASDRPGVTVVDVNLKFIWDVVSRIRIGQKGVAYVVDDKGFLVAHPDISLVLKKVDLSGLPQVRAALAAGADDAEWRQVEDARDVNGQRVLSAYALVPQTGWKVFVEEPLEEVLAPLYDAVLRTVLLLVAGMLISVAASLFLARRMVRPVRELQMGAERIGAGDLGSRITVNTGDELEDLAGRFNTMTEKLRESYADLERKVEDRTTQLREALDQQTATTDVLKVISSSPTDVRPVFDAIVKAAKSLGEAFNAYAFTFDGERVHYVTSTDTREQWIRAMAQREPWVPDRSTMTGRVVLAKATVQIEDMYADPDYKGWNKDPRASYAGEHRLLGVPMLRDGEPIGVLTVNWTERGRVPAKFVRLLETFAAQAVIAIENVRLFNETKEALEQQTATAAILRSISASPTDVMPVFRAIVNSAVQLGQASSVHAFRYEEGRIRWVASSDGTDAKFIEYVSAKPPWAPDRSSITGRVILAGDVVTVEDIQADAELGESRSTMGDSHRVLGVPMLREGRPVGVLSVAWTETGPPPEKFVSLLKTFAAQAVIAVENVRLFNEIREKSRQLEVANKHKSDFLANMSHELRTPLNAIIGFSEVMLSGMTGALPDKQKEFMGDIRDSGKHLLSLINDILDLSKIEAGRMELDLARFDLARAMDNAMTLVRGRAERHGIQLEAEIAPGVGEYEGDERKFKQIMLNLLTNAVKFTPEGGKVTMAAERVNGAYVFRVKDTGIGIAEADLGRIFEEFRQVGTDYARKAEGTGLGLSLTRKLVELHGGRIHVESEIGRGSTFTFNLPIGAP